MKIRRKWIRDVASIIFTVHYLIAAEQADEKVRKVRGMLTVDHLRVSWNKSTACHTYPENGRVFLQGTCSCMALL